MTQLFDRKEKIKTAYRFQSVNLIRNPRFSKTVARWSAGIFFFIVIVIFLPWTQNISSQGRITTYRPSDRPQTVQATIAGQVAQWYVREGQRVKKGDTIVRLTEVKEKYFDPQLLNRMQQQIDAKKGSMTSVDEKLSALARQISALKTGLDLSLNKAQNKLSQAALKITTDSADYEAVTVDYNIAIRQQKAADSLYKLGLISLVDLERRKLKVQELNAKRVSAENKLLMSRTEQLNAGIEVGSVEAEYIDKISKAESERNSTLSYLFETEGEMAKMNSEYAGTLVRSNFYFVTAPQDGYVVQMRVSGIGETVKEGDPICTVMPADPQLAIELYVKPMDVPLLAVGRKVRLQFDGWPALVFSGWPGYSFGTFGGTVAVIDNIDTKGEYRILVLPDPSEEPWPAQLRVGSGAQGWAMLNDVPIWYELWRQFNGFPPDYTGDKTATVSASSKTEKKK